MEVNTRLIFLCASYIYFIITVRQETYIISGHEGKKKRKIKWWSRNKINSGVVS
jgi:hypothetical protein